MGISSALHRCQFWLHWLIELSVKLAICCSQIHCWLWYTYNVFGIGNIITVFIASVKHDFIGLVLLTFLKDFWTWTDRSFEVSCDVRENWGRLRDQLCKILASGANGGNDPWIGRCYSRSHTCTFAQFVCTSAWRFSRDRQDYIKRGIFPNTSSPKKLCSIAKMGCLSYVIASKAGDLLKLSQSKRGQEWWRVSSWGMGGGGGEREGYLGQVLLRMCQWPLRTPTPL